MEEARLLSGIEDPFFRLAREMTVESADRAFEMLLGEMPTERDSRDLLDPLPPRIYDSLGTIRAEGGRNVSLSLGLDRAALRGLASAMLGGMEVDDESILVGCHQELLNIILGGTIGALSQLSPVKLGLPEMERSAPLVFDPESEVGRLLVFNLKAIRLEFLLKSSG